MISYKQWKMINESVMSNFTLGISNPTNLGINSPFGFDEAKKEKKDDVDVDVEVDAEDKDDDDDHKDCKKKKCAKCMKSKKKCAKCMKSKKKCGANMMDGDMEDDMDDEKDMDDENDMEDKDEDEGEDKDEDEGEDEGDDEGNDDNLIRLKKSKKKMWSDQDDEPEDEKEDEEDKEDHEEEDHDEEDEDHDEEDHDEEKEKEEKKVMFMKKHAKKMLKGGQHKLDVSGPKGKPDGKITKHDFDALRAGKKKKDVKKEATEDDAWWNSVQSMVAFSPDTKFNDGCGNLFTPIDTDSLGVAVREEPEAGQPGFAPQTRINKW